jgi:hypothetical protein
VGDVGSGVSCVEDEGVNGGSDSVSVSSSLGGEERGLRLNSVSRILGSGVLGEEDRGGSSARGGRADVIIDGVKPPRAGAT